jgi:hypothetical protein
MTKSAGPDTRQRELSDGPHIVIWEQHLGVGNAEILRKTQNGRNGQSHLHNHELEFDDSFVVHCVFIMAFERAIIRVLKHPFRH